MKSDLHIHTIYSDSTLTPSEVVSCAKNAGISCLSITDHETMEGIPFVQAIASDIVVIPGIEIGCEGGKESEEIHILGYFVDPENSRFKELLVSIRQAREKRVELILKKLARSGIQIEFDEVKKSAGPGTIGRLHIASLLYKQGSGSDVISCFKRYLSFGSIGWVEREALPTPDLAIHLIKEAGGISVFAHPHQMINRIPQLVKAGLMGIEVFHPKITHVVQKFLIQKATQYDLFVTGGSDCHGKMKEEEPGIGKNFLSDEYSAKFFWKLENMNYAQINL
ncbi:PHP domain-containing protein [bacterium]|nr:PHP domain-containing protein [bacterium]